MQIKRFTAATMREALAQVRAELSGDAVIVSNRPIDGGIELITAIDYDGTLIGEAASRPQPAAGEARDASPGPSVPSDPAAGREPAAPPEPSAPPAAPGRFAQLLGAVAGPRAPLAAAPARPGVAAEQAPAVATAPALDDAAADSLAAAAAGRPAGGAADRPADGMAGGAADAATDARPQLAWSQDPAVVAMRREVDSLRDLLQSQVGSLAWQDQLRRDPLRAQVLRHFGELGLAADVARALTERIPPGTTSTSAARIAAALLARQLPLADDGMLGAGGVYAIVGPTGVGKTTTIAKIAARCALAHGVHQVALISLDHYRIGARDQLQSIARILGVPMQVASNASELGAALGALAGRRLVLIDTAGMGPRDARLAEQFATLAVPGVRIRALLTLAANAEELALHRIVRAYSDLWPAAILLTKVDEAARLGPAFSVALRHALPIAQLAVGQRVPDDLHAAPARRVWLVKRALKLAARAAAHGGIDDGYVAVQLGTAASGA